MANHSKCEGIKSHSQTLVGQSKPQVREKNNKTQKQEDSSVPVNTSAVCQSPKGTNISTVVLT